MDRASMAHSLRRALPRSCLHGVCRDPTGATRWQRKEAHSENCTHEYYLTRFSIGPNEDLILQLLGGSAPICARWPMILLAPRSLQRGYFQYGPIANFTEHDCGREDHSSSVGTLDARAVASDVSRWYNRLYHLSKQQLPCEVGRKTGGLVVSSDTATLRSSQEFLHDPSMKHHFLIISVRTAGPLSQRSAKNIVRSRKETIASAPDM